MADFNRTHLKVNVGQVIDSASMSASGTHYVDLRGGDYKTLLVFSNAGGSAATVTVKVGDGIGGAGEDLTMSVAAGKTGYLVVDSSYYKITGAEKKGFAAVSASAAVSVTVVELP